MVKRLASASSPPPRHEKTELQTPWGEVGGIEHTENRRTEHGGTEHTRQSDAADNADLPHEGASHRRDIPLRPRLGEGLHQRHVHELREQPHRKNRHGNEAIDGLSGIVQNCVNGVLRRVSYIKEQEGTRAGAVGAPGWERPHAMWAGPPHVEDLETRRRSQNRRGGPRGDAGLRALPDRAPLNSARLRLHFTPPPRAGDPPAPRARSRW